MNLNLINHFFMRLLLILLLASCLQAQERWTLSLHSSLAYGDYLLDQETAGGPNFYATYCFGAELGVRYLLSDQWALSGGLSYQQRAEETFVEPLKNWVGSDPNGPPDPSIPNYDFTWRKANHYLELPLGAEYFFTAPNSGWLLKGALIHSFYLSTSIWRQTEDPNLGNDYSQSRNEFLSLYQLNLELGGAYRWRINGNWSAEAGLLLQHSLSPTALETPVQSYFRMAALELGFLYRL